MNIYREEIIEHSKRPKNWGALEKADAESEISNSVCGDSLNFYLKISPNGTISDIRFTGDGCAISKASASLITETVKGKSAEDVRSMEAGNVVKMLNIPLSPSRVKCALLPLEGILKALENYEGNKRHKHTKID